MPVQTLPATEALPRLADFDTIIDARTERAEAKPKALPSAHWFWGAFLEQRFVYRDVLWAALLINLFALAFPIFTMNVYDRVVPNHAVETLWALAAGPVGLSMSAGISRFRKFWKNCIGRAARPASTCGCGTRRSAGFRPARGTGAISRPSPASSCPLCTPTGPTRSLCPSSTASSFLRGRALACACLGR